MSEITQSAESALPLAELWKIQDPSAQEIAQWLEGTLAPYAQSLGNKTDKEIFQDVMEAAEAVQAVYGKRALLTPVIREQFDVFYDHALKTIEESKGSSESMSATENFVYRVFYRESFEIMRQNLLEGSMGAREAALICPTKLDREMKAHIISDIVNELREHQSRAPEDIGDASSFLTQVTFPYTKNAAIVLAELLQEIPEDLIPTWRSLVSAVGSLDVTAESDPDAEVESVFDDMEMGTRVMREFLTRLVTEEEPLPADVCEYLRASGIPAPSLGSHLRAAGNYENAVAPLRSMIRSFDAEVIEHILEISGGRTNQIRNFALLHEHVMEEASQSLSREDILKLDSLAEAVGTLGSSLKEAAALRIEGAFADLDLGEGLDLTKQSVASAIDNLLRIGAADEAVHLFRLCSDPAFLSLARGDKDSLMKIPASEAVRYPIFAEKEIAGIVADKALEQLSRAAAGDVSRVPRFLRKNLPAIADEAMKAAKRQLKEKGNKSPDHATLSTYMQSKEFVSETLKPILDSKGIQVPIMSARFAEKSDPASWTSGSAVRCCARFGSLHLMDSLYRDDSTVMVIEVGDQVVGFSRVWAGSDNRSLILNNIELFGIAAEEDVGVANNIRQFLRSYAKGGVPLLGKEGAQVPTIERATIGAGSGDVDVRFLPGVPVVTPSGDSPDTAGQWNFGSCDASDTQKLFMEI